MASDDLRFGCEALPRRFWDRVLVTAGGCWEWTASRRHGYGRAWYQGRDWLAHRLSFTVLRGPIPEGHELDHLCRNTTCVNPSHLEAVSHAVNVRRSARTNHDTCRNGLHPWPQAARQTPKGEMECVPCKAERNARRKPVAALRTPDGGSDD